MTKTANDVGAEGSLRDVYVAELRAHAVTLLWLAYRRLDSKAFVMAEEDDITGELVRVLRFILQEPTSPNWVDRYEVREQVPQNVGERRGKRRPRLDIELERHQRGPRPRLGFEAKRLGRGTSIGGYAGSEGLGAFLAGYYPTTHGEAGMLGYIQEETTDNWTTKLAEELSCNARQHRVVVGRELRPLEIAATAPAFESGHTDMEGKHLLIIHVLLPFSS